ncbi:MAG: DNA double-strand break repair nuclease NurA, partial [Candidatus Nanoarchaeia archaeon]
MYDLNKIVEQIREFDIKTKALVNSLKNFKELKSKINNSNFDKLKIVGVDGGFIRKEFHGASFALCRGVAVYFEYENGTLIKTSYFPEKKPNFRLIPIDINLPERDANLFCNLIREKIELETCINALEVFEPDILIRDGSIILYPGSLPSKESQIYSLYEEIMSLVKVLYEKSFLKNTLLCGAVEDSRGKRFCNFLKNFTN